MLKNSAAVQMDRYPRPHRMLVAEKGCAAMVPPLHGRELKGTQPVISALALVRVQHHKLRVQLLSVKNVHCSLFLTVHRADNNIIRVTDNRVTNNRVINNRYGVTNNRVINNRYRVTNKKTGHRFNWCELK